MNKKFFFNMLFALVLSVFANKAFADGTTPPPTTPPAGETDAQKLAAALTREEELKAELAKLKKGEKPAGGDDDEDKLTAKSRQDREEKDRKAKDVKEVERAVNFNLTIDEFAKANKSFLPETIDGILQQAKKETYDSAHDKANALKSAILSNYFAVQANMDSLTPSHKAQIDRWKTLAVREREAASADLYENVFEPAIDTLRRIEKAQEVARARSGLANPSSGNTAYKDRLVAESRKHHLREK